MAQVYKKRATRVLAIEVLPENVGILRNKGGLHMSPDGYGVIDDGVTLRCVQPGDWVSRDGDGNLRVLQKADIEAEFELDADQTDPKPTPTPKPPGDTSEVEILAT